MGQTGDVSAQQPQPPAAPEGQDQPMIEQDATPGAAAAPVVADETAVEDMATQIVPQASLTPPPATPRKPSGSRPSSGAPAAAVPPPPPPNPGPQQGWQHGGQQGAVPHVVPVVAGVSVWLSAFGNRELVNLDSISFMDFSLPLNPKNHKG